MPFDPTLSPLLASIAGTAARVEFANASDDDGACGESGCDCGPSCTCSAGECGCGS